MTLTEIRRLLDARQIRLTKSLGQHFLHDANQIRRIIAAAELTREDPVLEIGPGLGALTEPLLAAAGRVLAIEQDARLVGVLRQRLAQAFQTGGAAFAERAADLTSAGGGAQPSPSRKAGPFPAGAIPGAAAPTNLALVHGNALDFLQRERRDWSQWKVVANLPYSVGSPLLVELALGERSPQRLVVTLQLEVVQRLLAAPGAPDYGVLPLLVGLQYQPLGWFKIPAACFFPAPEVDSACICLQRRAGSPLAAGQRRTFVQLVKRAFAQRRKMMFKLLKQDWPVEPLRAAFERVGLMETVRAEAVSLEQFVKLAQVLHTGPSDP